MTACATAICRPISPSWRAASTPPRTGAGRRGSIRPNRRSRRSTAVSSCVFRPRLKSEEHNAALSLAANLAIADALQAHRTGLFRVMAEPDERAVERLRHTARAFGLAWPADRDARRSSSARSTPPIPGRRPSCWRSGAPGNGASYEP